MQILEAFRALNALNEDVFDMDADGIQKLSDFKNNDDLEDDISIIDPEAETEDELQDNYIGKVILDCCTCHSKLYKAKEEVTIDDSGELANVGEECPYCYTPDGFKIIGEVAAFEKGEDKDEDGKEEEPVEELFDANVSLDASGSSVGFLGGTGGSVTNESLIEGFNDKLLTEGKITDFVKKVASRVGAEATSIVRCFAEISNGELYELASYVENKAALKALLSGNEKLSNGLTKEDIEDVQDDISEYLRAKEAKKARKPKTDDMNEGIFDFGKKKKAKKAAAAKRQAEIDAYNKENEESARLAQEWRDYVAQQQRNGDARRSMEKAEQDARNAARRSASRSSSRSSSPSNTGHAGINYSGGDYFTDSLDKSKLKSIDEGIFDRFKKKNKGTPIGPYCPQLCDDSYRSDYVVVTTNSKSFKDLEYVGIYKERSFDSYEEAQEAMEQLKDANSHYNDRNITVMSVPTAISNGIIRGNNRIGESIEDLSMTANDTHLEVTEEENGKVTVSMEPVTANGGETIEPISPETEAELMGGEEEIPMEGEEMPADEESMDVPIDEMDEESMDELGESYFKRVYENVNSYKTTAVKTRGNQMIVEGNIKFNSGKVKKTSFVFEAKDATRGGKVRFTGDNKQLTEGKKAFTLTGRMDGKKLVVESMSFNYGHKDGNGNISKVRGSSRVRSKKV